MYDYANHYQLCVLCVVCRMYVCSRSLSTSLQSLPRGISILNFLWFLFVSVVLALRLRLVAKQEIERELRMCEMVQVTLYMFKLLERALDNLCSIYIHKNMRLT